MICLMNVVDGHTYFYTLFCIGMGMGMGMASGVGVSPFFLFLFSFFSFSLFLSFFHHSSNTDGFGREACNVYVFMVCCVCSVCGVVD